MTPSATFDTIGQGYARRRRPDPRIAATIRDALGDATSVANVGAGTGSYEPPETVIAIEPSAAMIAQRPADAAPCVQASAEAIPLPDDHADAAMAILTIHHWSDYRAGLAELRRIARRRVVILHWGTPEPGDFWLLRDYMAENARWDLRRFQTLDQIAAELEPATFERRVVPVPHDCSDGFLGAYWRRPTAYLDPEVRAGISNFSSPAAPDVADGLRQLAADLESGEWERRNGELLGLEELDLGYRLLLAELP